MKIDYFEIKNYKAFQDVKLTLDKNNTFLAGANNSGKTSLLEYINLVLKKDSKLDEDDISIDEKFEWLKLFNEHLANLINQTNDKDSFIPEINKYFNGDLTDSFSELKSPTINIQVSYRDGEDITLFAPYIMELDEDKKIFNFKIAYQLNRNMFIQEIIELYDRLKESIEIKEGIPVFIKTKYDIDSLFIKKYLLCTTIKYYFTNHTFDDNLCNAMSPQEFVSLFNCQYKSANRILDDNRSDNNKFLSSKIIDSISNTPDYDKQTDGLITKISEYVNSRDFKTVIEKWSTNEINKNIKTIKNDLMNNNIQEIKLSYNIMQESINELLKKVVGARFVYDNKYELREYSQGLGFSNYIYLCLCLQIFKKNLNLRQANLIIIEEPESHMHPQMQRNFLKYIENYAQINPFQIMISTHSTEFVKQIDINKVRVLKKYKTIESEIIDLGEFYEKLSKDEEKKFYNTAFRINLADCIFAEKCIVFEGDCEKLLLTKLLQMHDFKKLGESYVSLLQVGSAYSYQYYQFLKYIKLKTLYICDIDYDLDGNDESFGVIKLNNAGTTNQSIKNFYELKHNVKNCNCKNLYDWDGLIDEIALVTYQRENDGYARTLEQSIFYRLFDMSVFSSYTKDYLKSCKKKWNLDLVICNKDTIKSHELLKSNSNNKVNFILSLIFGDSINKAIPSYIRSGLKWLIKN